MYRLFFSLAVFAFMFSACGTTPTRETTGELIHQEVCRWIHERCCVNKVIVSQGMSLLYRSNLQNCIDSYDVKATTDSRGSLKSAYDLNLKNTTLDFNAGKAQECLNVLKNRNCSPPSSSSIGIEEEHESCQQIFVGNLPEGATCDASTHSNRSSFVGYVGYGNSKVCAPGLYCHFEQGANDRTCRKLPKLNESCKASRSDCEEGLFCKPKQDIDDPTCATLGKINEPCGSDYHCEKGLYCEQGTKCSDFAKENESCENKNCAPYLACENKTCRRYTTPVGGSCPSGSGCAEGLMCNENKICVVLFCR